MPTICREQGFRFFVYPNDHQPAHIHVFHSDGEIKIDISGSEPVPLGIYGKMSRKTASEALDIAEARLQSLRDGWEKFHGPIN